MDSDTSARRNNPVKVASLSGSLTVLVALGIIFIGVREFFYPSIAAVGYGVPLVDPHDADLLAIKANRDVISGVLALAFLALRNRSALACAIGVMTLIPVFDGFIVIRHAGWVFAPIVLVHWGTAAFMAAIVELLRRGR